MTLGPATRGSLERHGDDDGDGMGNSEGLDSNGDGGALDGADGADGYGESRSRRRGLEQSRMII